MGPVELYGWLVESTLAMSAALALVLLARRPLRREFGAGVAYTAWWCVPAALVAVMIPATSVPIVSMSLLASTATPNLPIPGGAVAAAGVDPFFWACLVWALGAVAVACRFVAQQRSFLRGLGETVRHADDMLETEARAGLPAAVGVLRPMILLPVDYRARYTPEQRELMEMHERVHIARGDLQFNAFVAVLRCVFWFNPLLHYATRHFRHDQELACDRRVIARYPNSRRAYGEAMFRTQLAEQPLPLGCHWGYGHPLLERIEMLKHPIHSLRRSIAGAVLVVALTAFAGVASWAAQPERPVAKAAQEIEVRISVSLDGKSVANPEILVADGGEFSVRSIEGDPKIEAKLEARRRTDGKIAVTGRILADDRLVLEPKLELTDGRATAIDATLPKRGGKGEVQLKLVIDASSISPERMAQLKSRWAEIKKRDTAAKKSADAVLVPVSSEDATAKYLSVTQAVPEGVVVTELKHGGGYVVVEGRTAGMSQASAYLRILSGAGWVASLDRLEKSESGRLPYAFRIYLKPS